MSVVEFVDNDFNDAAIFMLLLFFGAQVRLSLTNESYAINADRQIGIVVENDLLRRSPLSELLLSMLKSNGISCASL